MVCPVCESKFRHQIEVDLLSGEAIEDVASKYERLSLDDVKLHAVAHMSIIDKSDDSSATKLALREADVLSRVHSEYMATLTRLGKVIDTQLDLVDDGSLTLAQAISKSTVDLYLGTGNQIRETVRLLSETYADMNADSGAAENKSSIGNLVQALNRSRGIA